MKRKLAALAILALGFAGCHAQVPSAPSVGVTLTWAAATSCGTGQPACTYAVYRCTATCGSLSSTTWAEITNPSARPSGTTFSDTTVPPGVTADYVAETIQGGVNSEPSNMASVAVPGIPTAPALNTPTTMASLEKPAVTGKLPPPTGLMARR